MLIGVPRELLESENRGGNAKTVQQILKLGFDVIVEHDAGFKASFEDQAFIDAGAKNWLKFRSVAFGCDF